MGSWGRRQLQAGFFLGQRKVDVCAWTPALPANAHLGLAPHWVRCPGRWSVPGTAAAQSGGSSYFVDTNVVRGEVPQLLENEARSPRPDPVVQE